MFKLKGLTKYLVFGLAALTIGATFSTSLAWFTSGIKISPTPIAGNTLGAFFAGGDGSEEDPYVINHPIHIYNLSWLQYLGEFNKKTGNDLDKQFFFTIENDIDMSELGENNIIPPIGTSTNPFVGNINGNGHVISNFEITNDYSDLNRKPGNVTSLQNVNIVGFFGVVGKPREDSLVYNSQKNQINNLGLNNFEIKTSSSSTLCGLAAGYVNGVLSGVAVNNGDINVKNSTSAISSYTTKLSDYGTVGFCEPAYREKCNIRDIKYYDPDVKYASDESGGDQWGASIAMRAMYDDISNMNNSGYSQYRYVTAETRVYDGNDNLVSSTPTADAQVSTFNTSSTPYRRIYNEKYDDGHVIASYAMNTGGAGNTQQFNYMTGETYISGGNKTITERRPTGALFSGSIFTDEAGNYLSISGSNISNSNTQADAAIFQNDTNNRLYTTSNGTNYYLRFNNGNISYNTTANNGSSFTYDAVNKRLSTTYNSNTYVLAYDNGWKMVIERPTNGFYIYSVYNNNTNVYYNYNNASGTSESSATIWYLDASNRLFCYNGNNGPYYLGFKANNTNTFSTNTTQNTYATLNNGRISCIRSNNSTTYYLSLSRSSGYFTTYTWGNTTTANSAASIQTKASPNISYNIARIQDSFQQYSTTTRTETSYFRTKPTYIPLTWEDDSRTRVSDKNTGYLISGAQNNLGDIRVSEYALNDIRSSHSGSSYKDDSLQIVTRTKDSNGYVRIKDSHNSSAFSSSTVGVVSTFPNYMLEGKTDGSVQGLNLQKYKSSRNYLQNVLKGQTNIYGLHFMTYPISKTNLITADKVTINGPHNVDDENKVYYDYQLPQGSIDFNLKKKGYINFFAGTYYSNNDSFFAVSEIVRDENQNITDIKEISKIFLRSDMALSSETPYVYQYNGEPVPSNAATLMFDIDWITSPTIQMNALYYFEFPMNPGEYALSAEENKTGAYLIYLDIGAANKTVDTTVITEKYSVNYNQYEYPKGVDFYIVPIVGTGFEDVQGGDIAAIAINPNSTGIITFKLTDSILTCGPPTSGLLDCVFEGEGITVKNTNNQILHPTPIETGEQIVNKVTTYYYRHEDMSFSYDIITETIEPGMISPHRDEFFSPIEEGVESNPYDGTQEYISDLTDLVSGFRLFTYEEIEIDFDLVLNPLTDEYVITFYADADVDVILKIDDSIVIPPRFIGKITISNINNCPPIQAGQIYTFSITAP